VVKLPTMPFRDNFRVADNPGVHEFLRQHQPILNRYIEGEDVPLTG